MGPRELATLLLARRRLAARLRWTPARLAAHRASALAALRAHAYAHSPFYRDFHAGLTDTPLDELPVVTKAELMANFDALVIDPGVRLAEVERHLETASATTVTWAATGWPPPVAPRGGEGYSWSTQPSGSRPSPPTAAPTPGPACRSG